MDIVPLPVPWLRQQSSPASISFLPRWIGAWVDWLFKPLATYLHPPAKAVGTLEDDGVWVDSLEDIQFLWNHGFFGKGTLSRSEPSWRFSAMKQKKGSSRSRKKGAKLRLGAAAHLATGAIGSHGQPSATETGSPDQEALQIDSCEAVFLSFFLGSLVVVYDQLGTLMNPTDLWNRFRKQHGALDDAGNAFVVRYAAYHYFRSAGWVVRPGIKFGTDFGRDRRRRTQSSVSSLCLSIGAANRFERAIRTAFIPATGYPSSQLCASGRVSRR